MSYIATLTVTSHADLAVISAPIHVNASVFTEYFLIPSAAHAQAIPVDQSYAVHVSRSIISIGVYSFVAEAALSKSGLSSVILP